MSGSDVEPTLPHAEQVVEQMREATNRLRDQAWMVAPLTTAADLLLDNASESVTP